MVGRCGAGLRRRGGMVLAGLALACGAARPATAGHAVYLALGDSITFGVGADDSAADVSDGDRGYVSNFANYLAGKAGGARPSVINLAVSGETSSSFFGNGVGLDGPGASARNKNYGVAPSSSQDALMLATIAQQLASGNSITNVTLSIGANDLFVALASGGSFPAALAAFQANEVALLTQIRGLLPTTNLILLNYFDPYAPFLNDPTSPFRPIAQASSVVIPAINALIASDARAFGAGYADDYSLFRGVELADTYIATGNVHPTAAGYALIAAAVETVPEPASAVLVGVGGIILGSVARRRRSGDRATAAR